MYLLLLKSYIFFFCFCYFFLCVLVFVFYFSVLYIIILYSELYEIWYSFTSIFYFFIMFF